MNASVLHSYFQRHLLKLRKNSITKIGIVTKFMELKNIKHLEEDFLCFIQTKHIKKGDFTVGLDTSFMHFTEATTL